MIAQILIFDACFFDMHSLHLSNIQMIDPKKAADNSLTRLSTQQGRGGYLNFRLMHNVSLEDITFKIVLKIIAAVHHLYKGIQ